jgi:hypothetical protein
MTSILICCFVWFFNKNSFITTSNFPVILDGQFDSYITFTKRYKPNTANSQPPFSTILSLQHSEILLPLPSNEERFARDADGHYHRTTLDRSPVSCLNTASLEMASPLGERGMIYSNIHTHYKQELSLITIRESVTVKRYMNFLLLFRVQAKY